MSRRVITNSGMTYGKQIGTSILTSLLWGIFAICYDFFNGNDWLFPFLKGKDIALGAILTTSFIGTVLIVALAIWVFAPNDAYVPEQRLE